MSPRLAGLLLVVVLSIAAGLSPLAGDVRDSLGRFAAERGLPETPGRELVSHSCLSCHSAMLITQQRKDSTAWASTVGLMERWGAPIPDSVARDSIHAYLVQHFGRTQGVAGTTGTR